MVDIMTVIKSSIHGNVMPMHFQKPQRQQKFDLSVAAKKLINSSETRLIYLVCSQNLSIKPAFV